jgi:hypothetical protein
MKLTKSQLKQIIKEEIKRILEEEGYLHPESSEHEGKLLPICKDKVSQLAKLAQATRSKVWRALPDEAIAEIDAVGSGSHTTKMKIAQKWLAADPRQLYPGTGNERKHAAFNAAKVALNEYTVFRNESYDQSVGWYPDLPMDMTQPPQQICRDYLQQGKIENSREEDLYPLARLFH